MSLRRRPIPRSRSRRMIAIDATQRCGRDRHCPVRRQARMGIESRHRVASGAARRAGRSIEVTFQRQRLRLETSDDSRSR
jgi:hypothetical protein